MKQTMQAESTEAAVEVMAEESRRDRLGRKTLTAKRRAELLSEYHSSGLSQAAFARRAGVRYPTFAHWVQQARKKSDAASGVLSSSGRPRFAEVKLPGRASIPPPTASELSVALPGGLLARGTDAAALAKLVRALLTRI